MRYMILLKANADSEAGKMPSSELLEAMTSFNEELVKAGVMVSGEGLHPSSNGARVQFSGKDRIVIDGPFAETKELVAGFWIWEVASLDEAIEWVKKIPGPFEDDVDESVVEIRKIFEASDFGDAFTPELQAREQAMRDATEERYPTS